MWISKNSNKISTHRFNYGFVSASGKILLQTTPSHLVGALDKALREAATLEGVLELRNEHFWTVGFGTLVGSLYARVRRDANEQVVLAHITKRLHPFVKHLTVQVGEVCL